jgi:Kdo2-lipid IVA lauroyltransferase/acyltransferase
MPKERNDLIDRVQYLAFRVVAMMLQCWPVNANLRTAKFLGGIMYRLDRRHRERALANLRRSLPEMSERQRQVLARRSMEELFMFFIEMLYTTRLIRIDTWARYIHLVNFEETLAMMVRRQGGLIMLTGHYGNFEILGYLLATLGFPTSSVARPLDNPYLSDFVFGVREKQGQRIIAKKGATDDVVEVIESGGAVAFVADQNAGSKGMFVDFFGRKASTYKSIGLLAMQYETPVVIGYSRRLHDRFEFVVGVQDVIHPQDWKSQDDPLRYITQRYTKALEDVVRADPGQYWWVHRRWKTRPKGEAAEAYD